MLGNLRRIVQELNEQSAEDFALALQSFTKNVCAAVETEACSFFLFDREKKEYVLVATNGLNPDAIGKVRLRADEGIISLVGQREELINLEDARAHPKFLNSPEVGEDRFAAFLGAPVIHQRQLLGVLLIQQELKRTFDETEEAFLVTVAAQLAAVIAHAKATRTLNYLFKTNKEKKFADHNLLGLGCAPGIGIGLALVIYPQADLDAILERTVTNVDQEIADFKKALTAARRDIEALSLRMKNILPETEQAVFSVYLQLLQEDSLGNKVIKRIQENHTAQAALRHVIQKYVRQFTQIEDEYLRERADDFRDLGHRILAHLQSAQKKALAYPEKTILVGEEISAADLADVPEGQLAGIVSARGSQNSHVAIIARALNVPAVMGVQGLETQRIENKELIVDGYHGKVFVSPSFRVHREYKDVIKQQQLLDANLDALRTQAAETLDGQHVLLLINTGLQENASLSLSSGADGVGLFRTEIPFMSRDRFPAEEEQRVIYRQLLSAFAPRPVIMRTLDVGGDKPLSYFPIVEDNPFLGWRGIRITLDHPEVFLVQLRAMIRANRDLDNLRIMLPMVTNISEVDEALALVHRARKEIQEEEGIEDITLPPVGTMIEVPSAVYQLAGIAKRVDFMSVGSNDLIQYLLAVDRNNARVAYLYDPLQPAVLQCLQSIIHVARDLRKPISICGEIAGDPYCIPLLLGMGYDAFSMNSSSILRIKWVIRHFSTETMRELWQQASTLETAAAVRQLVQEALIAAGLSALIKVGKT